MDPPESQRIPTHLRRASSESPVKASYPPLYIPTSSYAAATPRKMCTYNLGDTARPSDVKIFQSVDEHVAAVKRLSKGGHCFILRSDFSFTYAKVIKHEVGGMLEVQVTEEGGTKSIPLDHWGKYIRTLNNTDDSLNTQHPVGGAVREGQLQSKKVRSNHGRRHEERPSRQSNRVSSTGSKSPVSTREGAPASFRSSLPNLDEEGHYKSSQSEYIRQRRNTSVSHRSSLPNLDDGGHYESNQSEYIRQRRNQSPYGSDESPGVDDAMGSSTMPELPFTKDFRRTVSQPNVSLKKQHAAPSRRRESVSEKPLKYPSIPTKEFKRSVSLQTGDIPLKKCLKKGHSKRSQSESGQHRKHESSESDDSSSSSLDSSLSLDSIDDSSLRAQEDLNKLLSKSMPSLKRGLRRETRLRGAFGDVTEIEILD